MGFATNITLTVMPDYKINPEAAIARLVADHGVDSARRQLGILLADNDKVRQAFIDWAIGQTGRLVSVPHLGRVK